MTDMSKHTPGPWKYNKLSYFSLVLAGAIQVCKLFCGGKERDEVEANACLIAAAPDMLEALEAIVENPHSLYSRPSLDLGIAAIAKAKGN